MAAVAIVGYSGFYDCRGQDWAFDAIHSDFLAARSGPPCGEGARASRGRRPDPRIVRRGTRRVRRSPLHIRYGAKREARCGSRTIGPKREAPAVDDD